MNGVADAHYVWLHVSHHVTVPLRLQSVHSFQGKGGESTCDAAHGLAYNTTLCLIVGAQVVYWLREGSPVAPAFAPSNGLVN